MTHGQDEPDAPALPVAHFPKQAVVVIHGMRLIGYSDQGGRSDGQQIMSDTS